MRQAALSNETKVKLGQMAQTRASNPAVKSFGERMIKDHSSADNQLKNLAESQHISLLITLDAKDKATEDRLSALSGTQFDKAYMTLMVQEHTKDVNESKNEAATDERSDRKATCR